MHLDRDGYGGEFYKYHMSSVIHTWQGVWEVTTMAHEQCRSTEPVTVPELIYSTNAQILELFRIRSPVNY